MIRQAERPSPSVPLQCSDVGAVQRVRGISRHDFGLQFETPGVPVVVEGLIDRWHALEAWTPEFWRTRFGSRIVGTDEGEMSVGELIDLAVRSTDATPAPYLRSERLDDWPGLVGDVEPTPALCEPNWYRDRAFKAWNPFAALGNDLAGSYELFIGGQGRAFPYVHFDSPGTHTFIHQLRGIKRFLLFSPDQAQWLYAREGSEFHISAITDADRVSMDDFPLFANASPVMVELGPGDTLFIPCGWWHFARMRSFSVSVAMDVLNRSSWAHAVAFTRRKSAHASAPARAASLVYLRLVGITHGVWT